MRQPIACFFADTLDLQEHLTDRPDSVLNLRRLDLEDSFQIFEVGAASNFGKSDKKMTSQAVSGESIPLSEKNVLTHVGAGMLLKQLGGPLVTTGGANKRNNRFNN